MKKMKTEKDIQNRITYRDRFINVVKLPNNESGYTLEGHKDNLIEMSSKDLHYILNEIDRIDDENWLYQRGRKLKSSF